MITLSLTLACMAPPSLPLPAHAEPPLTSAPTEEVPLPLQAPDGEEMAPCLGEVLGMACIPGGPFERGTAAAHACTQGENRRAGTGYGPPQEVWQQTFWMDLTEVTYGEYQRCAEEGLCPPSRPAYNDYDRERQPMVGVTWYAAQAFCAAEGKHLPTEAEWEKAARGPGGDAHPFGDAEVTCAQAVVRDAGLGRSCGVPKAPPDPEKGRTWEVGLLPAGHHGLYDMVGNAEEWVADWFAVDLAACGADCQGTSPKGPCQGAARCPGHTQKMVKGGSWYWGPEHAYGWHRRPHFPENRPYHHFGFRCAASLAEARWLLASQRAALPAQDEIRPSGGP